MHHATAANERPNDQMLRSRFYTWSHWVVSGSILGPLSRSRHTAHFRSWDLLGGVGIFSSAEQSGAPIISPAVEWANETGSTMDAHTEDWICGDVAHQISACPL